MIHVNATEPNHLARSFYQISFNDSRGRGKAQFWQFYPGLSVAR